MKNEFKIDLSDIPTKYGIGKLKDNIVYDWLNSIDKKIEITDFSNDIHKYTILKRN